MSAAWILRLPREQRPSLARCRRLPGLEIAEEADAIWVRGPELKDAEQRMLRAIPRGDWFELDPQDRLRQEGRRLSSGSLPQLWWRPIGEAIPITLPGSGFAGSPLRPAGLELVRSSEPRTPNLLLVMREEWSRYGETAPLVRLAAWKFAADRTGRILVRGLPLPPLPGQLFVEEGGIALPAGWALSPSIPSGVLSGALGIARGDIALFCSEGTWEHLTERDFVPAARAAIRLETAAEVRP